LHHWPCCFSSDNYQLFEARHFSLWVALSIPNFFAMSQNLHPNSSKEKPFLIELWEDDLQPGGHFTPAAAMLLSSSLRTSGLLYQLSPDDLKSLIFLLTFVSPEGHCQPFLSQLTDAMRVAPSKAKVRMRRLCDTKWKGEPLVIHSKSASGLTAYSLNPRNVTYRHRSRQPRHNEAISYMAAPREAIIEYSRQRYARPREEVERIIARQMGHDVDESDDERKIRYRLENAGLTGEQARELLATYHLDTIAQQLDWLPFRHAKNPAGYLIAAIEGNYSEPRAVREERIFRELRYGAVQVEAERQAEERESEEDSSDEDSSHPAGEEVSGDPSNGNPSNDEPASVSELAGSQAIDLPFPHQDAKG
jgi:hypothetical protein